MATTNVAPRNQVRFIWFSAEEAGLLSSAHDVSELSSSQIKNGTSKGQGAGQADLEFQGSAARK